MKLPRNWQRLPTPRLQALADELERAGSWPEFEMAEEELEMREAEDEQHPDTPSLEDRGLYLGSYGS